MNEGNAFDIRDGIFRVPVTGLYMFTVHALPMEDRPFMVQIHLNDQSVAAFSNGESGRFTTIGARSFTSLKADLCQDINRGFAFSRCLNGTFT